MGIRILSCIYIRSQQESRELSYNPPGAQRTIRSVQGDVSRTTSCYTRTVQTISGQYLIGVKNDYCQG